MNPLLTIILVLMVLMSGCQTAPQSESNRLSTKNTQDNAQESVKNKQKQPKNITIKSGSLKSSEPSSDLTITSNPRLKANLEQKSTAVKAPDLEAESLYDLLTAELAGKQNRLDITLGNYLKQAHKTRDPQIVRRTTRIARFMKAHQATLDAAKLWVEIEPNNEEALQTLTMQLVQKGDFETAFLYIDRLIDNQATANFDFLVVQVNQLPIQRRTEVLKAFDTLLDKHPKNPQLWLTKALILQQNDQLKDALKAAQLSLEIESSYIAASILEANLLNQLGKTDTAIKKLKSTVKKNPDHKQLTIVYARLLIQTDQLKAAQAQFASLVKKNPDDDDLVLSMALLSWENKLNKQAKKYLETLISEGRKVDTAHLYLAQIYEDEQNNEQAIKHYQQISLGPLFANSQIALAALQQRDNKMPDARQTLAAARSLLPQQAINFYAAEAELLDKDAQTDAAFKLLGEALLEFPNDTSLLYSRAMLHEQNDHLAAMEKDLRKILAIKPNSALALNALGYTLADRTERFDEALDLISKALSIKPNDPAILDSMGWVHFKLNNHQVALQYLQKAYQMLKDHEIAAHLGEVLWQSGKEKQAKRIWREGLKNTPESTPLTSTLQRLWPEGIKP